MSVYLGNYGQVELRRVSDASQKASVVNPGDVNVARRRFSFDFDTGFLNSGDQLELTTTNGVPLAFIDPSGWAVNQRQTSGSWYVHVDELGGLRLYSTFDESLSGLVADAVPLTAISNDIPITAKIVNAVPNILAQTTYFELSTNREVADTTGLGEEFRSQHSGLISGSGSFRAFWEYLPQGSRRESAHYLLQLAVRTEVGSKFTARLYLKYGPADGPASSDNDQLWYDIEGVITQAGVNFSTDNVVEITADFITTGPIRLLTRTFNLSKVLQENNGDIRLEQDASSALLQEGIE